MRTFTLLITTLVLISACQDNTYKPKSAIKKHIAVLAHDSLKGREVGTPGEKKAADYIVQQFKAANIQPGGEDGFYQSFFVEDADNPHAQPGETSGKEGITGYNVVGLIDNPGDQVVVIGAHYDHLGMGDFSSLYKGEPAVHNGADDNASGVAAMLHLATVLKNEELNRDFLFIGFSGEEKGLWGSNYYTKNPTIDLSKVNFMVNMDMVGRLDEDRGLAINGLGTSPAWTKLLEQVNQDSLKLVTSESGVGPSDHTSFYLNDIPVLHFFTGQHADYHKPGDDVEKVNVEGIIKVADLIQRIILETDTDDQLAFTKTKDESDDTPRFTVTLGVIPDYLFDGEGMRIDGVSEDKPAQRAGIQKGDVVVQMGDSTVTDMMSYMRALSVFEKGDETTVVVNREGTRKTFEITFNNE